MKTKSIKTPKEEFKKHFPETLFDEPLKKYSTFQIGGQADFFYRLKDNKKLSKLLEFCGKHHVKTFILGGGSNVLFDDKGFRGIVIKIATNAIKINRHVAKRSVLAIKKFCEAKHNITITADGGVNISKLVRESLKHNFTGLENLSGLPGTVGGAVRGNAGCNGLEIKDILISATILNPKTGKIKTVKPQYFHFAYRTSKLKKTNEIVLSATFRVNKSKAQKDIIQNLYKKRISTQPFGLSAGSFFKNPSQGYPAGMLIDKTGLKGKQIGKAKISEKHANFFLNLGGATSKDMIKLARLAHQEVKKRFNITLKEEVQIVTEKGIGKL
ncbi:MAG: UDP-N-acetylmuramate dehydrogenase [Patescibacteria group bacterium]